MRCDVPTNIKSMSFRWLSAPAALVALVALGGAAAIGCESTPVAKSPLDPGSTSTESGPPVEPGAESAIPTAGANPGDVPPPAPVAPDQPAAPTMSPQALADYEQGFAAFNNANISGAVQAFTSATKVDPRAYKAFFALGAMHERAGNVSGALSAYQQSFVIQPDFSAGIVAYALLQAETGNLGAAETILVQKRSALTKSAALAAALAEVKSQSKDSASAQQLAQESLKLDPTFAPAMLAVARDHYRARRLDQVDCWLQIQAKVDKVPVNILPRIFFLFQDKHVMVEELLQLFVCVVDAQLFERVCLEDFKAGNVQNADKGAFARWPI